MTESETTKHLEFVLNVINRMASNSFLLKGWSITLVAALFALAAKESNVNFVILALLPSLSFWWLDAYYLRQERLYRKLYDSVRVNKDFTDSNRFSLDATQFKSEVPNLLKTLWSSTIIAVHGALLVLVILLTIYLKSLDC